MMRFQHFLAFGPRVPQSGGPGPTGSIRLAVLAGYADQAHVTRECVRVSGRAPATLRGRIEG